MIQVRSKDSLIDIIEKIEREPSDEIIISFPLGHPLLHSRISLKIIQEKSKNKKLLIVSKDKIWRKIGKNLGIPFSQIQDTEFISQSTDFQLRKHNFSFWEYFVFQLKKYKNNIFEYINFNKKVNIAGWYSKKYSKKAPINILLILLCITLWMFMFVYYFAVNKTVVEITPNIKIKKEASNFILQRNTENSILWWNKFIKIERITQSVQLQESFPATEIILEQSSLSQGTIQVHNLSDENIELIAGTRFRTVDNTLEFVTKKAFSIPAASTDNFWETAAGTVSIEIEAQVQTPNGEITGTKWDIPKDTKLILPWLSEEMRKRIFAVSTSKFSGWSSKVNHKVWESDIEYGKKILEDKMKSLALEKIQQSISEQNKENTSEFRILTHSSGISYHDITTEVLDWVQAGDERENFQIQWKLSLTSYSYNADSIIQKLKSIISEKTLPGVETILHIDPKSLRLSQIIYAKNERDLELKATFEIDAYMLYDFSDTENSYLTTLKEQIRWLDKEEAQSILINNPHISQAKINIRPFFVKKVSNIVSNIVFKIEKN